VLGISDQDRLSATAGAAYLPRVLLHHLADTPDRTVRVVAGTCVFIDVSGFTKLSEQLARRGGREGAERLADTIGASFERLLTVAYAHGGALLKFGGDALLLLFQGDAHVERACRSAVDMRRRLREAGPIDAGGGRVQLRMSVGVHSADYPLFVVGRSHRELLITGPPATEVVRMEKRAGTGEIVVSAATAASLPARCLGAARGNGRLLRSAPALADDPPDDRDWTPDPAVVADALSTELRAHVLAGPQPPEHRVVTVAFLRFEGVDRLISDSGADAAAAALGELVAVVQEAADEQQICFLGSDVDADGGKLILTAGAPRAAGDEEERMLLALRRVVAQETTLPVRIGVSRGPLFAGDIGPWYRRTYTVMGDVVNLAARLMAKAPQRAIYAAAGVVQRSPTRFETSALEPLSVKGIAQPVHALSIGAVLGRRGRAEVVPVRFPLVGRERELTQLERALDDASRGRGRLIELVSEPGMGKSRLMEEVRDRSDGVRVLHATCEPYTAATPYSTWSELLRKLIGLGLDDADHEVAARLLAVIAADDPVLAPWLPLLAVAAGAEADSTPEVEQLAPDFRAAKLHEVVLRFLRRQLPGWALIEIEDAHLMDEASTQLILALARDLPLLPWLVVVTRRDRETGFKAPPAPHLVRLELEPLGPEQTLSLANIATEAAPLPPHAVALAARRSGGSPQFLRDLLRAAASGSSELPESIEAAAIGRIDRLEPADRALVRRASVLGLSFHPRQLDQLADADVPATGEDTWNRLAPYFTAGGGGYLRFRRQVVRDAAYAGLPFRERRRLHAAAGAALERELAGNADEQAARLSVHFLLADDHARAWRYARVAADHALERAAYADAASLYRRALDAGRGLEIPPDALAAAWESLAEARVRTGELRDAAAALTTARRLVADDPVRTARLLWLHARIAERVGNVHQAVRWSGRALRVLDGQDGAAAAACRSHVVATLAAVRQRQGRSVEAIRLAHGAIADGEAAGEELAVGHACQILDWALVESGRAAEAGYSSRALDIFRRHGAADRESAVLNNMGGFAYRAGRWDEAVDLYRGGAEASARAGDVNYGAFADCNVGEVLSDQGRLDEAEPLLRRALQVWRGTADEHGVAFVSTLLGRLYVRGGRTEEGVGLLRDALARFRALRVEVDAAFVEALLAEASLWSGRPDEALAGVTDLRGRLPDDARLEPLLHHIAGVALDRLGDRAGAREELEAAVATARSFELPFELTLGLDALERLGGSASQARRRERDALLAQLDIVRLPSPPTG
jgi:class 3 adenylate cyclase/tetratricopeptide (TPR) repeat protein